MSLRNHLFWIAALIGLVADRLTKLWIVRNFELNQTLPILEGIFHLTFVTNKGAAFSLFSEQGGWLRWLSLAVSLGLLALGLLSRLSRWEQVGYGCILAGALGNGIDRFFFGEVVDFLDFRIIRFPVFNLADISINIGILCLLIAALKQPASANNGR
jgi:signal peptidase II